VAATEGRSLRGLGVKHGTSADRVTFVIGPDGQWQVVEGAEAIDPTSALEACPLKPKKA